MSRAVVLSDSHFPARGRGLSAFCYERISGADLLIHAGDLCDFDTLVLLRALGPPLVAVHGNVDQEDVRRDLPETTVCDLGGCRIGLIHDAGPEAGRRERLRHRFPECGGVIFGHSHIPLFDRAEDGFWILNPGSVADRRRQPHPSMAELSGRDGGIAVDFFAVDDPPGPLAGDRVRGGAGVPSHDGPEHHLPRDGGVGPERRP